MDKTIAKVTIKPDCIDAFIKCTEKILAPTRAEEGCLFYEIYQDDDDKSTFYYVEQWATEEDFMRHVKSDYVSEFGAEVSNYESGPVQPIHWHKVW